MDPLGRNTTKPQYLGPGVGAWRERLPPREEKEQVLAGWGGGGMQDAGRGVSGPQLSVCSHRKGPQSPRDTLKWESAAHRE